MTLSISATVSAQMATTAGTAPVATGQIPQPQPPTDTVTISLAAQVTQLKLLGQSSSEIADNLGIPVSMVDSDLGIVATTITSAPAAAPTTTSVKGTSAA